MEIIKDLPEIFDEFEDKKKQSFLNVKTDIKLRKTA